MRRSSESYVARFMGTLLMATLMGASVGWMCVLLGIASAFLVGSEGDAPWPADVMFWLLSVPEKLLGVESNELAMGSIFWGVVSGLFTFVVGLFLGRR